MYVCLYVCMYMYVCMYVCMYCLDYSHPIQRVACLRSIIGSNISLNLRKKGCIYGDVKIGINVPQIWHSIGNRVAIT